MGHITIQTTLRQFLWILLLVSLPASAAQLQGNLLGLGLHVETGRDIYLGGIYLASGVARPPKLDKMPDPWVMEYRIVARRTSIRSLLGGMLLQSEVATGQSPGPATTSFADQILSNVRSSLYAGDALEIQLKNNATYATLNGQRLALSSNPEVAAYFLAGWISQNGPSSAFRETLLADTINPELLARYQASGYSQERRAEVAAWLGGTGTTVTTPSAQASAAGIAEVQGVPAASPLPETEAAEAARAAAPAVIDSGGATDDIASTGAAPITDATIAQDTLQLRSEEAPDTGAPATVDAASTPTLTSDEQIVATDSATAAAPDASPPQVTASELETTADPAEPVALASGELAELTRAAQPPQPGDDAAPVQPPQNSARLLDVQEYSQRLVSFHSDMVARVYSEIRYPKRAVRRNLQGRLELDVSFSQEGELLEVSVALSSGHKMLDEAASTAALNAFKNKMDYVDDVAIEEFGTQDNRLIVPIPVQFRLQ